ncbi:sensor histidine kinase [Streptomyces sp. S.PNR 29]|uniref:sensor histidine kinase n=1 Tax=Streptomyces sp. S.PNR 29 TaxID=2973805 RepID=UPI0025B095E6|nr:sensor histidine kinase [Streptomyces sp. S.PNR 29]MDN0193803.1 sensor domain-containing protein [Streptomyces sp. S.PNR 29]
MTVWQALGGRGYLGSAWPWRAGAFLASGALFGAVVLVVVLSGAVVGAALAVLLLGLPLLVLTALAGIPVAAVERWRLRLAGVGPLPAGSHRMPDGPGLPAWLSTRARETATWRELAYALLLALVLWPLDALAVTFGAGVPLSLVATPVLVGVHGEAKVVKLWTVDTWAAACGVAVLGLVLLAAGAYALGVVAGARAELARALLVSRESELVSSRVRLVDAFEAERRRIERDLHDGAQQRLVALTMTLGLARLDAPPGPLAGQLAKAHGEAEQALAELRDLIHGIHPRVLADYGLEAAVADAADRSPVPVDLGLDLSVRLPRPVESAAYFVVCEALANIARHSGASRAEVRGTYDGRRLVLDIRDDGRGGADPRGGTGLTGLADRVSVLDGRLSLSSPPGGPTLLHVEFPCRPTPRSA